jgi:hypothetical protein
VHHQHLHWYPSMEKDTLPCWVWRREAERAEWTAEHQGKQAKASYLIPYQQRWTRRALLWRKDAGLGRKNKATLVRGRNSSTHGCESEPRFVQGSLYHLASRCHNCPVQWIKCPTRSSLSRSSIDLTVDAVAPCRLIDCLARRGSNGSWQAWVIS